MISTARERAKRLVQLYALLSQVTEEIRALEVTMAGEQEAVRQAREASQTKLSVAMCGTDSGYYRHIRRLKQPACQACLVAHRIATRERERRKKEAAA